MWCVRPKSKMDKEKHIGGGCLRALCVYIKFVRTFNAILITSHIR